MKSGPPRGIFLYFSVDSAELVLYLGCQAYLDSPIGERAVPKKIPGARCRASIHNGSDESLPVCGQLGGGEQMAKRAFFGAGFVVFGVWNLRTTGQQAPRVPLGSTSRFWRSGSRLASRVHGRAHPTGVVGDHGGPVIVAGQ